MVYGQRDDDDSMISFSPNFKREAGVEENRFLFRRGMLVKRSCAAILLNSHTCDLILLNKVSVSCPLLKDGKKYEQ